jgi:hypothetical protein
MKLEICLGRRGLPYPDLDRRGEPALLIIPDTFLIVLGGYTRSITMADLEGIVCLDRTTATIHDYQVHTET